MTATQLERNRVIRSKERVIDPIPAAFAEKMEEAFEKERKQWEQWKEWERTWNPVEIGQLLGIPKDTPIRGNIAGKVREMVRERDELRRIVKGLVRYVP